MKLRILVAGALALALCSCSTISALQTAVGVTVSQKNAAAAVGLYNTAETGAIVYLKLPVCAAGQSTLKSACKNPGAAKTLNAALDKGDKAVDALVVAIKTAQAQGSGVGVASAAYQAVVAATTSVNSALPTN